MDIDVNHEDGSILKVNLLPAVIKVTKNYVYNEAALLDDPTYKQVYSSVLAMNKKQKYMREINDSHDVVAYLMLLINSKCADLLNDHKTGIFRIINIKEPLKEPEECPTTMQSETYNLIKMWQISCGQYTSHKNNIGHQLINSGMGVNNYVHISSPIRRLVDLLNMLKLQSKLGIPLSKEALDFYDTWEKQLTYINTTMRSIRKIQTDCSLLHLCVTNSLVLEEIYEGYLFDKITRPNKLFQYTIYIPKIKMFTRINIYEDYPHYANGNFKLYLIQDGTTFKQKIKAAKVE
jgi:exoribonuclease R